MSSDRPMLHMFCGKIAAGKSTLAGQLAEETGAVLITEDAWLDALYADVLVTPQDYLRCTNRLRSVMGPHVAELLSSGNTVVLDFSANTKETRGWLRDILDKVETDHQLHVLAPSDQLCLDRLRQRNAAGTHPFAVTEAQFHQFARYFSAPTPDEGFNLVLHAT